MIDTGPVWNKMAVSEESYGICAVHAEPSKMEIISYALISDNQELNRKIDEDQI